MTRRNDRRIALVAGAALALVFTFCGAIQVAAWSVGEVERSSHRVIAGPISELRVEAGSGDVTILPSRDGNVRVDSRSRGTLHRPGPVIEDRGAVLRVSANCPVFGFRDCDASVVVRVPASTRVVVDAASGDINADDVAGGAELRTSSGDVSVAGLAGDVRLETASGDIDAGELRAAIVRAHTASGDVELRFDAPPRSAQAETSSGDVRIAVPRDDEAYDVDVETQSGDPSIGVRTDPDAARALRANTASGDATVEYTG